EDITKAVQDAVAPINERLDALEKANQEEEPETKDDIVKAVSATLTKALKPIEERLGTVEAARGITKQEEKKEEHIEKAGSLWDGVL
ncbi:hypothetical protein VVG15_20210, partial [Acinetobacter baumannii]